MLATPLYCVYYYLHVLIKETGLTDEVICPKSSVNKEQNQMKPNPFQSLFFSSTMASCCFISCRETLKRTHHLLRKRAGEIVSVSVSGALFLHFFHMAGLQA